MAGNKRWSREERKLIQDFYPDIPLRKLMQALPGRSDKAVRDTASRMGLKKGPDAVRDSISQGLTESHARRRVEKSGEPSCDTVDPG